MTPPSAARKAPTATTRSREERHVDAKARGCFLVVDARPHHRADARAFLYFYENKSKRAPKPNPMMKSR